MLVLASWTRKHRARLGNTLAPSNLQDPPTVRLVNVANKLVPPTITPSALFSSKENLTYALALVDPDAPSHDDPKWADFCHWLVSFKAPPVLPPVTTEAPPLATATTTTRAPMPRYHSSKRSRDAVAHVKARYSPLPDFVEHAREIEDEDEDDGGCAEDTALKLDHLTTLVPYMAPSPPQRLGSIGTYSLFLRQLTAIRGAGRSLRVCHLLGKETGERRNGRAGT